jgi:hypothetical protein
MLTFICIFSSVAMLVFFYCLGRSSERERCRKIVNQAHAKVSNLSTWSDGWQHACKYALRLINGEPGY